MDRSKLRKFFRTGCKVVQALVPARHPRRIVSSMLAALLLASNAQAQTQTPASAQTQVGDWQAVESLKRGTPISVKARRHVLCLFKSATEHELVCKPPRLFVLGAREARFDRQSVREVRIRRNRENDGWIGAGIGAGAGGVIGAGTPRTPGDATPIFDAGIGTVLGGIFASVVPIFHHDKTIYKR